MNVCVLKDKMMVTLPCGMYLKGDVEWYQHFVYCTTDSIQLLNIRTDLDNKSVREILRSIEKYTKNTDVEIKFTGNANKVKQLKVIGV